MASEYLPIAVRAYTERVAPRGRSNGRAKRSGRTNAKPRFILVFDTETSTDASQQLLFGSYQYWRITWEGAIPRGVCVEEGLFYADDLPERNRDGFAVLQRYAKRHKLKLISQQAFNNEAFYKAAYKVRATIVAFNLPFDLSRIAHGCGDARGRFAGGFSLIFFGKRDPKGIWRENRFRPRVAIKTIDSKRHLVGFTRPPRIDPEDRFAEGTPGGRPNPAYTFRGHFLDLRTLAFALTDESHSLKSACEAFGVEHPKEKAGEHGRITPGYIDYNRRDVTAAAELFFKLMEEYAKHPIDLQPTKAYSPASIAKAYLKAMGIRPILERQPRFPKDVLGYAMTSYFGGRAECRIRRVPVPVVYMDFQSMYPTVCTLMNLWQLLTSLRVKVVDGTPEDLQSILSSPTLLADCFEPRMWRNFVGVAQIEPEEALPVRSRYDAAGQTWQIGVNPLTHKGAVWYSIPDVIAATLLTGRAPRILRVIMFIPLGISSSLRPTSLRGAVPVDPRTQDFFKTVIEERMRCKTNRNLSPELRDQLSSSLKVIGNAGSYGIFAQMDRRELPGDTRERVRVHGLDRSFEVTVPAPEEPGEFAFPPVAACITGGARLMLVLLERCVTDAGGAYAFCDTDSMAVVATESGRLIPCLRGPHRLSDGRETIQALAWAQVEDIRERSAGLNPYSQETVPGSILKLEDENFDTKTRRPRQLWCYAISAKRYVLFNLSEDDKPTLRKWSEHGLGHLLNPTDPDEPSRDWIRTIWEGIVIEDAFGQPHHWPDWLVRPAVGRIKVSSPLCTS